MADERRRVLIVDDEESIRNSLRLVLTSSFDVDTASCGQDALHRIATSPPDLLLLDVMMPQMSGLEVLRALRQRGQSLPVIMLTGASTVSTAVEAMKGGAVDFVNKPFDVEQLTATIVEILDRPKSEKSEPPQRSAGDQAAVASPTDDSSKTPEATDYSSSRGNRRSSEPPPADFGSLVGRSSPMAELFARVGQVCQRDTTVLITGESGTGKELIARRIHELSARSSGPFVAINCAAIPETLIESELFGHEKGAFTHATERRIGHFELADKGTLLLDEIGELNPNVQVKMLRFLQEQEFYRVGRSKPIRVDVRIIAATNKNLEELSREGRFRQDLFYRINVVHLALPPLRDRFEDVPALVEYFVKKFSPQYGGRQLSFSPEAITTLVQYSWPGNVRELENVIESLMALTPHDEVSDSDLPRKLKEYGTPQQFKAQVFDGSLKFEEAEKLFEREMIVKALKKTNFVQTRAAELLGISRRILKYKMDKLGISDELLGAAKDSSLVSPASGPALPDGAGSSGEALEKPAAGEISKGT